jgi:hypothetical protein
LSLHGSPQVKQPKAFIAHFDLRKAAILWYKKLEIAEQGIDLKVVDFCPFWLDLTLNCMD